MEPLLEFLSHPVTWYNFVLSLISGVVLLGVAYLLIERYLERRKEPARRILFGQLVSEALLISFSCNRIVSFNDNTLKAPVLNDRFGVNLGWAYMSTIQFNEQLSLFSGNLDHGKVEQLSDISSIVSKIRMSLNILRQFDNSLVKDLSFYAPADLHHADLNEDAWVAPETFKTDSVSFLDSDFEVVVGKVSRLDRETEWRIYFAIAIHNLLWDAFRLCLSVEKFAGENGYHLPEVEAKLKQDGISVYRISEMRQMIDEARVRILDNGIYLVNHVFPPSTVMPQEL